MKNGVQSLYHFTHIFNVPLIAEHGFLSKKLLLQLGLWGKIIPGGNQVSQKEDARRGNDDYVSLAYTPYFPMAWRRKREHHICFFEFDVGVVDKNTAIFTRGNATSREHDRNSNLRDVLDESDLRIILAGPPDRDSSDWYYWHTISQSEVLIRNRVDSSAIKRCVVLTRDALEMCSNSRIPFPVEIDKELFYDKSGEDRVNFSYADDLQIRGSVAKFRIYSPDPASEPQLELLLLSDGPYSENFELIRNLVKDPSIKELYQYATYPALLFGSSASVVFGKLPPGKYTALLYSHGRQNIIPWSLKEFWL